MGIQESKQVTAALDAAESTGLPTLSTTETASRLGCTRQNVADLYKRRQLRGPAREPGSPVRIFVSSIETYETRRNQGPQPKSSTETSESGATVHELLRMVRQVERQLAELQAKSERLEAREQERQSQIANLDALHGLTEDAEDAELDAQIKTKIAEQAHLEGLKAKRAAARARWTLLKEMTTASIPPWVGVP